MAARPGAGYAAASLPAASDAMSPSAMITRPIPKSGEAMPVIGLGTWQTFDVGSDAKARQPLREVVQRLVDAGGRMIDSSPMYGRAEGVTGDLVAEMVVRSKVFLATKVWATGKERGIEQVKRSATLLRSAVVDLMQIHNLVDWQTQLQTMRQMKSEGRIRYLGITHYTASALRELAHIIESDIDFVQLPYSIEGREAETELLPAAQARGVAVIVNRPFEEGGLFRRSKGRAAGMVGRDRLQELGAVLPQIHRRPPGGDLCHPGDIRPAPHGRRPRRRHRPAPRRAPAPTHARGLGRRVSALARECPIAGKALFRRPRASGTQGHPLDSRFRGNDVDMCMLPRCGSACQAQKFCSAVGLAWSEPSSR
jgi:diketogulonate reductase-like aldo/keto reductase